MKLRFETDLATSLSAAADLGAAYDKVAKNLDNTAKEAKKLEAAAARIVSQNLTPLENYNKKIEQLGQLQAKNLLTAEQATRAATKHRAELERLTTGFVSLESVEESAKRVTAERNAEMLKAERTMVRTKNAFVSLEAVEQSGVRVMREHNAELAKSKKLQDDQRAALERSAQQIRSGNLTATEAYRAKLRELVTLAKEDVLSKEEARKAAARYKEEMFGVAQGQEKSFGSAALSSFKSYVMGLATVSTAVALVRSELEAIRVESEKTTQTQLSASQARDKLKRNIAPAGVAAGRKIEARADALAGELGLPQRHIDAALAEAFSSSDSEDQAFSRTRVASQFLKTAPEGIGQFTGALGDISKVTKSSNDLRNLGFLINVGAKSRVSDDKMFSESFPKMGAGMASYGATAEEAGALFDALGVAAADQEGRMTGTGGIQLAAQLAEKVKGADFGQRLQSLWNDPKAARKFVDDSSFESKVKGPMQEFLLDPNSPIAKQYRELKSGFGSEAQQIAKANETINYLDEGRTAGTAAISRTINSGIEQYRLSKDGELSTADRDEIIERNRQLTENDAVTNRFATWLNTGPTMTPQEAISELQTGVRIGSGREGVSKELIDNTQKMIDKLTLLVEQQAQNQAPKASGRQQ